MEQPNPNINTELQNQTPEGRGYVSNEMADFSFLMGIILDYYYSKEPVDDGEEWRASIREEAVDEEVDEHVKKAFIAKLKKHQ